jgi:hypothetical protein
MSNENDIVTRLRRWPHAVHADTASDLMDAAAAEIESLRSVLAASMREITRLTTQNDTLHTVALALRDVNASLDRAAVAAETNADSAADRPIAAPASSDAVNHPAHYSSLPARCECGRAIEAIQVVEWLPANLANVVKYCWRQGFKVGDGQAMREAALLDVRKAAWYAAREVARLESMR